MHGYKWQIISTRIVHMHERWSDVYRSSDILLLLLLLQTEYHPLACHLRARVQIIRNLETMHD
eukprot:COSAG05_NODE_116_length_17986_cov_348.987534_13_plen_63_part_00